MPARRPQPFRTASGGLALTAALAVALTGAVAAAAPVAAERGVEPGSSRGGQVVQQGWWSRSNERPPETGLTQPPSVPAVNAPAGTLPVAMIRGEDERIAALQFDLAGKPGSIVTGVTLVMAESSERGANIASSTAGLQACPVTDAFWVGVENGAWSTQPLYDCEAGVAPGVRDDDGVWSFDLTALAAGWTSVEAPQPAAVMLVGIPPVDPADGASSFQVAFDAEEGIGLRASVTAPGDDDPPPGEEPPADDPDAFSGGDPGSTGGFGAPGGVDTAPGGGVPAPDPLPAPDSGAPPLDTPAAASTEAPVGDEDLVSATPAPAVSTAWYSGLGVAQVALLVVALGLAYLVMVAMGAIGQPAVGANRPGLRGVSRALARRRPARTTLEESA